MRQDLGIRRVFVVANKVAGDADLAMVKEHLPDIPLLGAMSYNEKVIEADKLGVSPYDTDAAIRAEVEKIIAAFEKAAA